MADPLPPGITTPEQIDALPLPDTMKFAMKRYLDSKQQADLLTAGKEEIQKQTGASLTPRENLLAAHGAATVPVSSSTGAKVAKGASALAVGAYAPAVGLVAGSGLAGAAAGEAVRGDMAQPVGIKYDPYETHVAPDYNKPPSTKPETVTEITPQVDPGMVYDKYTGSYHKAPTPEEMKASAVRKASVLAHIAKTYHGTNDDITGHLPPITPMEEETFKKYYPQEYKQMTDHLVRTSPVAKKVAGVGGVDVEVGPDALEGSPTPAAREVVPPAEPKDVEKGLGTLPQMNKYAPDYSGGKEVDKLYKARANPKNKYGAI